jgi:hypothetical protein
MYQLAVECDFIELTPICKTGYFECKLEQRFSTLVEEELHAQVCWAEYTIFACN